MKLGLNTLVASVVLASGLGQAVASESMPLPFPGELTGNIGVFSSYDLRGITNVPENSGPAVQGGLDYSHDSGFYAGYWFSTLDYSADPSSTQNSFESDFYAGFNFGLTEDVGLQVGGTAYYYYPGKDSTGYETIVGLSYKDFGFTAQTLLNNVTWGNKGDTYLLASYEAGLPAGFTGKVQVGAYSYGDDDEFTTTTEDFAFRHATLGLSHDLGNTGATWSMDYIVGGYDRVNTKQKNKVVLGLAYGF